MTLEEFNGWSKRHSDTFCLFTDRMADTFAAWFTVFTLTGYSIDELHDATTWLAVNSKIRFASEHLPAIQGRITSLRLVQARLNQRMEEEDPNKQPCKFCQGYGWVTVPRRDSVIDGKWVALSGSTLPTSACCCDCQAGNRIYASHTKKRLIDEGHKPPIRLHQYERDVPHWQELMKRKEQEANARGWAASAAAAVDSKGIIRLTAAGMKPPEPPPIDRRTAKQVMDDACIKPINR